MERPDYEMSRREVPCASCGGPGGAMLKLPMMRVEVPMLCPDCQAREEADEEEREILRKMEHALERAGRDARMRDWSFSTYPRDAVGAAAVEAAEEWIAGYVDGERANLILHGSVGGGKTGLAWCVVRDLIVLHGVDAMLVNWRELLAELRQSYADRHAGQPTDYMRVHRVGVLVLDDVGAERPTDWAREELASVVEQRYARQLPTVVTSNYPPSGLAERIGHDDPIIGQRIVSRLTEGATQHEIKTRDRRLG
jgi:DNA replication protein DnaC